MYIPRNLEKKVLSYLKTPEILAVIGPRQCGKTTMIIHILEKIPQVSFVSFDDRTALRMFEESPDEFISAYIKGYKYIFIDEFHYAREGGKILKYIYDSQKIKIIISGSSAIDLSVKAIRYLVGRIITLHLFPFNFEEFLRSKDSSFYKLYLDIKKKRTKAEISKPTHQKLSAYFQEYLIFGGYPRVVLEKNQALKKELLKNIYQTYFLKEVKTILELIDDYKLEKLIKALSLQIGSLIDYKELSSLTESSYPTLKKYLNFLEKTYICKLTRPYFKNKRIEIVKTPKIYFFDTGLRNAVVNDFRKIDERPDGGTLLENGVAMELIKKEKEFYFWRDKSKKEIDFVVSLSGQKYEAFEVKTKETPINQAVLAHFSKLHPKININIAYLKKGEKPAPHSLPVWLI